MSEYTYSPNGQLWQIDVADDGRMQTTAVAGPVGPGGPVTAGNIVNNAMLEIGALDLGGTPSTAEQNFVFSKLKRLLDNWNAESLFIYSTLLQEFTLTPNHNPHTIGTAADFVVASQRPASIDQANLILTDVTPNIYRPLKIVDDSWWMNNPVPSLATQIPYYLYYNQGWPNGQIYLWPVPTKAYGIRLRTWTLMPQMVDLTTSFTMPAGYEDAVTLSLAESLVAPFRTDLPPTLARDGMQARARIKSLNSEAPEMQCDGAVQSMDARPRASIANFLSGFFN